VDRLAAQGMRFTRAYSACTVCSPTRASILTGQYPARLHITDWIAGHKRPYAKLAVPDWRKFLPTNEVNLARTLKSAGYATASIGKWHLGPPDCFPDKQGFDINLAGYDRGQPPSYFAPYRIPTLPEGPDGEFLTDRESAEACRFIEQNKDRPFFLYLPHYAVHTPLQGKTNVIARYRAKARALGGPQTNATYAALVESVDDSLGRIMGKLDELKLTDNTIVIYTGDNGGLLPVTSNLGIRAGKGSAYEGGVRVPLLIRWPARVKAGIVSDTPVISVDYYPTLLELAGVKDAPGHVQDGASLAPLLLQTGPLQRDTLYWHYPHYHPGGATPYSAIREGDLKLIEFFETGKAELFDLRADPLEKSDLAETRPQVAARLRGKLTAWRKAVDAQLPTPNPDYEPQKERGPGRK
jgi:arylsulfatase A-like enzyme